MWFDGQADQFDAAAGLPPDVGRRVAGAVVGLTGLTGDDALLDVGAGTGAVGLHFAGLPGRYLALDLSRPMLDVFRQKLGPPPGRVLLVQADGDRPWPVGDRAVAVVFASRVAHHLHVEHFVREALRVGRPGGHLLLGQVRRGPDSLPSRLQRHKRALLAEHGLHSRGGGQAARQVVDACRALGAIPLSPTTAARWSRALTARQLLSAWEGKPRLNSGGQGNALRAEQRAALVSALTDWARREFGDLDRPHEFAEEYALQGARLP